MKRTILIISFILFFSSDLFSLSNEEINKIRKTTWAVKISVNVEGIYPFALQYAVFETDPIKIFNKHMMRVYQSGGKKPAKDRFMKNINMSVEWDMIFKKITADNVSLLPLKTEANNPFSVRSNSDPKDDKVWIVTKAAHMKDNTPLCWCIPVNIKKGCEFSIIIDMNNIFNLEKQYDSNLRKILKK